jgi:Protein of unknown function (DUF1579)
MRGYKSRLAVGAAVKLRTRDLTPPHSIHSKSLTPVDMLRRIRLMRKRISRTATLSLTILFAAVSITLPSFAQSPAAETKPAEAPALSTAEANTAAAETKKTAQPPDAEMMKQMMELAKLNDNHKLLAGMVGNWSYTVKMWMDPASKPSESTGTAVLKSVMDGRYVSGDYSGKFKMPGADGKMKEMNFKGMSLDGYDNVKQKFVSGWVDNMGTGIMLSEGAYDAATKTFTFNGEYEAMPGMKSKVREVIKIADKDHHSMEYYEDRGQGEMKSMEINYSRKK